MSQLMLYKNSLLKPDEGVIKNALLSGDYIICCTLREPPDIRSLIIETVTCIKQAIPGVINGPAVVEYGVSNDENNTQYRLHDNVTAPLLYEDFTDKIVSSMLGTFNLFIRDNGNVNRQDIYGKIGTEYENTIVYRYE